MMSVATQQQKTQNKLKTRKRKGQDGTKRTSALAESCIQFPWSGMPNSMTALTWMVRTFANETPSRISHWRSMKQNARQYNSFHLLSRMLYLCLALMNLLLNAAPRSSSLVDHGGVNTTLGREVGQFVTGRRQSPRRLLL